MYMYIHGVVYRELFILLEPIIAPVKKQKFLHQEKKLPETTYKIE